MATGRVRVWHDDDGWGVVDSDDTPSGCWAHYSSLQTPGFKRLAPGDEVIFTYEVAEQDGFSFRTIEVWPAGHRPFANYRTSNATNSDLKPRPRRRTPTSAWLQPEEEGPLDR